MTLDTSPGQCLSLPVKPDPYIKIVFSVCAESVYSGFTIGDSFDSKFKKCYFAKFFISKNTRLGLGYLATHPLT